MFVRTTDKTIPDEEEGLLPIPTQFVSNGEFYPPPQTARQKMVEDLVRTMADERARKLGVSRRRFLRGRFTAHVSEPPRRPKLFVLDHLLHLPDLRANTFRRRPKSIPLTGEEQVEGDTQGDSRSGAIRLGTRPALACPPVIRRPYRRW